MRANASEALATLLDLYAPPPPQGGWSGGRAQGLQAAAAGAAVQDSGTTRVLALPFFERLAGTLDAWLLRNWWVLGRSGAGP